MKKPLIIKIIHSLIVSIFVLIPLWFNKKFVFVFTPEKTYLFMFLVEVIFFLWIYLAILDKHYRPKFNWIYLSGLLFLISYTIAGILGVNPMNSFWSSISRMSGLILIYHVAMLVVVLGSCVRDKKTWNNILVASVLSSVLVSIISFFDANSTIGNTSYVGAYLLANAFISIKLFRDSTKGSVMRKVYPITTILIILSPTLLNINGIFTFPLDPLGILGQSRAASISLILGLFFLGLFALCKRFNLKIIFNVAVSTVVLGIVIFGSLIIINNSYPQVVLDRLGVGSRIVFWNIAEDGIADRPLLGWGPENYYYASYDNFDPVLYDEKYNLGREVHTDKPHNIFLEIAVSGGLVSLLFFLILIYFIFSRLSKNSDENAPFIIIMVGLLIQNMFLFDTPTSYLMLALIIGYSISERDSMYNQVRHDYRILIPTLVVLFISLKIMVFNPANNQKMFVESFNLANDSDYGEILSYKPYQTSSTIYLLGKIWIEFPDNKDNQLYEKNVNTILSQLKSSIDDYGDNYRLLSVYSRLLLLDYIYNKDEHALEEMKVIESRMIDISPNNPEPYWIQAQRLVLIGDSIGALEILKIAHTIWPDNTQTEIFIDEIEGNVGVILIFI